MSFQLKFKGRFSAALPGLSVFLSPLDVLGSLLGLIVPVADAALLILGGFKLAVQLILAPILFFLGLVAGATGFLATIIAGLKAAFDSLAANLDFTLAEAHYSGAANQFQTAATGYFATGNGQLVQAPDIFNNAHVDATVVMIAYVNSGVGVSLASALAFVFPPAAAPVCTLVNAPSSTLLPGTYYVRYAHISDGTETFAGPAAKVIWPTVPPAVPQGISVVIEGGPHGVGTRVYLGTDQYDMRRIATTAAMPATVLITALPAAGAAEVLINPLEGAFLPAANVPFEVVFTTSGALGITWKSHSKKSDLYVVKVYTFDPVLNAYPATELHAYSITETSDIHTLPLNDHIVESGQYKVTITTTAGTVTATTTYTAPAYMIEGSGHLEASTTPNMLDVTFSTQRDVTHSIRLDLYDATAPTVILGRNEQTATGFDHTLSTTFTTLLTAPGTSTVPPTITPVHTFALVDGALYFVVVSDLGPVAATATTPPSTAETLQTPNVVYTLAVPLDGNLTVAVTTFSDLQEKPVSGTFRFLSTVTQMILTAFRNLEGLLNNLNASVGAAAERKLGMELMIKYFEDLIDDLKKIIEDLKKFLTLVLQFKLALKVGFNFGDVYIFKYHGPLDGFGAAAAAQFANGLPGVSPPETSMQAELYVGTSPGAQAFLNLIFGA